MKLPVIFPEIKGQRYDCERCGRGCRELVVFLTETDRRKIDQQKWADRLQRPPYIRFGRGLVLNHQPNGDCVFLGDDGLCAIHAKFGFKAKPLSCQLYPFTLEPDGDAIRVSVRFDCPAIAKNAGGPLADHRRDVTRIAAELKDAAAAELAPSTRPVELTPGRILSSAELDSLVAHLDGWLSDTQRSIMDRLLGLHNLIDTLAAARLNHVRDGQFDELLEMLVGDLPAALASVEPAAAASPSPRQLKLFRQATFSHCENVRLEEACQPLLKRLPYRIDQFKRARQVSGGTGRLPCLVLDSSGGTFDQLEQVRPHPELEARACDMLLTRYLRARLNGRTAFGHGYHGWPALDGLRALLLAVAVTGWVTRYLAVAGGQMAYDYDDLVRAIGIVDRNATRSPELGTRPARLRLQYLTNNQGIPRLLNRYRLGAGSEDEG